MHESIDDFLKNIQFLKENRDVCHGVFSGYESLDRITNGWQPEEVTLFLARPGSGKSLFLLNLAYNAYMSNKNVIYVTLEMPKSQQEKRLVALHSNFDYEMVKKPYMMGDTDLKMLKEKTVEFKKKNNFFGFIDALKDCSSSFIENQCEKIEKTYNKKINLLVIDPIYYMTPDNGYGRLEEKDRLGIVCQELKCLARRRQIPILAASQFNRESHKRHLAGKEVDSIDAALSDKLSHVSDTIIGLQLDKNTNCITLSFAKTRDFESCEKIDIVKEKDKMRLYESKQTVVEKGE